MDIIKYVMGGLVFGLGFFSFGSGIYLMLRKEYREALRTLAETAPRLAAKTQIATTVGADGKTVLESKSPVGELVMPLVESGINLIAVVKDLIQTAAGVGAFLILGGLGSCLIGYWMASS